MILYSSKIAITNYKKFGMNGYVFGDVTVFLNDIKNSNVKNGIDIETFLTKEEMENIRENNSLYSW